MASLFLIVALAGLVLVSCRSTTPSSPIQPSDSPLFELRPGENYIRLEGRPAFVLGRNTVGTDFKAYDEHFRHAGSAGKQIMRIHFTLARRQIGCRSSSLTWLTEGGRDDPRGV